MSKSESRLGLPVIHSFIHSTDTKYGLSFCRVLVPTVINFLFGRFSFLSSCSVSYILHSDAAAAALAFDAVFSIFFLFFFL